MPHQVAPGRRERLADHQVTKHDSPAAEEETCQQTEPLLGARHLRRPEQRPATRPAALERPLLPPALRAEQHAEVVHRVGGHEAPAEQVPERVLHRLRPAGPRQDSSSAKKHAPRRASTSATARLPSARSSGQPSGVSGASRREEGLELGATDEGQRRVRPGFKVRAAVGDRVDLGAAARADGPGLSEREAAPRHVAAPAGPLQQLGHVAADPRGQEHLLPARRPAPPSPRAATPPGAAPPGRRARPTARGGASGRGSA